DLVGVSSLGFRGEALSSIAAVAQVELITKTATGLTGVRYIIEGGVEKSLEEIGAPEGTTFLVRNLFFNTPARKKFLKSPVTEAGYIGGLLEHLALSHPSISFKFINNNQTKLHTSGNTNLKDIIYGVYGREITSQLLSIDVESEHVSIYGFIGKPTISRGNRNYESYYINGRYIKSHLINKAIEDAYKTFMMQHKYPFAVLHFTISGHLLDVNVHPNKMELRFENQDEMYQMIYDTVKQRLSETELIPQVKLTEEKKETPVMKSGEKAPEPFEKKRMESLYGVKDEHTSHQVGKVAEVLTTYGVGEKKAYPYDKEHSFRTKGFANVSPHYEVKKTEQKTEQETEQEREKETEKNIPLESQLNLFDEKLLSEDSKSKYHFIGQLFDTYWLIQFEDKLYMIDQHAAHEKVMYERTMKGLKSKEHTSQYISPPIILTLNMQEEELLNKYMDHFKRIGFVIDHFGGEEYSVSAVPGNLYSIAHRDLLIEMLDGLEENMGTTDPDVITEKIASISCKAAVKGNNRLSLIEAQALVDELLTLDNPYHCPHGRPTIISMSKYELEKKFKRIV
ncbi:MAG TPA: DNA mismatch repair protein MutL, partial [Candidatus Merdenecus merdavium]|nr:DNA mismatch repair protein MutL [Candidatus Merdenecus merdavium]